MTVPALLLLLSTHQKPSPHAPAVMPRAVHREVPDWCNSKLQSPNSAFTAIRQTIQARYGSLPQAALSDGKEAAAAYRSYLSSHKADDGFRSLYLRLTTQGGPERRYEAVFSILPKDDYEVARLHFLWSWSDFGRVEVSDMGERLLAKNPNDVEVLYAMSSLSSELWIKPDHDLGRAERYAARLISLKPCALTYGRMAAVQFSRVRESHGADRKAEALARAYFKKFLAAADPRDAERIQAAKGELQWLDHLAGKGR